MILLLWVGNRVFGEVGMITGLVASVASFQEILESYPYLEDEDIRVALAYASWRSEEYDLPLQIT